MKFTNADDYKRLTEEVLHSLPEYRYQAEQDIPPDENFQIDQILFLGDTSSPDDITALATRDDETIRFHPLNADGAPVSSHSTFSFEEYSFDSLLFEPLEQGYAIAFLSPDLHETIWTDVSDVGEDIENREGLRKYISYCQENGITCKLLREQYGYDGEDITSLDSSTEFELSQT